MESNPKKLPPDKILHPQQLTISHIDCPCRQFETQNNVKETQNAAREVLDRTVGRAVSVAELVEMESRETPMRFARIDIAWFTDDFSRIEGDFEL
jgi:hypothetical protein